MAARHGSLRLAIIAFLALAGSGCAAPTPPRVDATPSSSIPASVSLPPSPAPTPSLPRNEPILVVGDSIVVGMSTYGGGTDLLTDDTWIPETVAEVGISVRGMIPLIEARESVPAVVVVGLGTNPSSTLGEFPSEIATLVDDLRARGAQHILWIPPHHLDPALYAEREAALRAIEGPGVDILDWPYVLSQHPEWFQDGGLHLTAEGYEALALFVRDSLRTLPI